MSNQDLRFADTHEWARNEGGVVTIGLSAHAIEQLGDIVYLELPAAGDEFAKGDAFGVIESVKAASDMYAPVEGSVVAVNDAISDNLDALKEDTYGDGWLVKIEMSNPAELDSLMDSTGYEEYVKSESDD